MPGHLGERFAVARVGGNPDGFRFVDGKDCQREPGTHAADAQQDIENFTFVVGGESEQGQRILADDQGGEELAFFPGRGGG